MASNTAQTIKERLGIAEVVGQYVELQSAGKNMKGKCPFHNEKTPSFFVSPDRGTYYCFGCQAKGDIFSFVEQFEGLDFMGALKLLAERAGVPLEFDHSSSESKNDKERFLGIMEEAARFFEGCLVRSTEAQKYLEARGLTKETITSFRIGFIPDDWRLLYNHLKTKGIKDSDMEAVGLVKASEKGFYDRFRGRIMFPISDSSGRVIAFTGRILVHDEKSAKYLNSPDTILFNKSSVLFGIDKAKSEIRRMGYSILVEGQMDLIMSHQAGIRNTVAVSGTALTDSLTDNDNQVNNLGIARRLSPNIILAFDSDKAGRKATLRSAQIALSLGMDVKVADMPQAKDPADLILEDKNAWKEVLKNSVHVVEFILNGILREHTDSRKIGQYIKEFVFPFLARIQGTMEKSHFVALIHKRTGIDEHAIWEDLRAAEKKIILEASRAKAAPSAQAIAGVNAAGADISTNNSLNQTQPVPYMRIHSIEKEILGILSVLEHAGKSIEDYTKRFESILGTERYTKTLELAAPHRNDYALEAEVRYGTDKLEKPLEDLFKNFEIDFLGELQAELISERDKAELSGDSKKLAEIMQHFLEISKKRDVLKNSLSKNSLTEMDT